MFKNRGQSALEYLILISIVLAILIPAFYTSIRQSDIAKTINEAELAVNTITSSADEIYSLGPGNKNTIEIYFPSSINKVTIKNREVTMALNIFDKQSEIASISKANLTGVLSNRKGNHIVSLEHLDNNIISITEI